MEVRVEVASGLFVSAAGDVRHLVRTQNLLRQRMETALGVAVNVRMVEPSSLERAEGGDAPRHRPPPWRRG